MYHGDRSRKEILVAHGFRLPSALDNRPLTFEEFEHRVNQVVYVSATPGPYELTKSGGRGGGADYPADRPARSGGRDPADQRAGGRSAERDPPARGQHQRVLVTTLTKRMAEDLAEYYSEVGVKCNYLHSEVSTLDRMKILRDLRRGEHDVLIGINLLREGLDLPEVSLVAILDADKEGFLAFHRRADPDHGAGGASSGRPGDSLCRRDDGQHEAGHRRNHAAARSRRCATTKRTASPRSRSSSRST